MRTVWQHAPWIFHLRILCKRIKSAGRFLFLRDEVLEFVAEYQGQETKIVFLQAVKRMNRQQNSKLDLTKQ